MERCRDAALLAERQGSRVFELRARLALCQHSDDSADLKALGQLLDSLAWALPEVADAQRLMADRI